MRFDVLTLFPEIFETFLESSIIGRAIKNKIIEVNLINIRDYSKDKHKKVDDYPYGGGPGMVMQPEPIYNAYVNITKDLKNKPKVIYLTPQGKVFNQNIAQKISKNNKHLILLCGHYEGVDERIVEEIVDMEISIGDYILTGGEIPAIVLIDAISRLIPNVLGHEGSAVEESLVNGLLEYPHYTRPYNFKGREVPEVLLSGNHSNIEKWRMEQSITRTIRKRPDLIKKCCN